MELLTKKWTKRLRNVGKVVGCMQHAHPFAAEQFYLRLLFNYVQIPKSFKDLCTFNEVQDDTFHGAALARELLSAYLEWERAIPEISLSCSASAIRKYFVMILLNCDVSQPLQF